MSDEKKRYIPARVSGDERIYYNGGIVFASMEEARKKAQQSPNESRWAVLELFVIDPPDAEQGSRVILEFATVAAHQSGCEIVYDRNSFRSAAEKCKADPQDIVCYAELIDYAGKDEAKEDFVVAFYPYEGEWRYEWKNHDTGQKVGWNGDEYLVKIQLPVNREVPREQR